MKNLPLLEITGIICGLISKVLIHTIKYRPVFPVIDRIFLILIYFNIPQYIIKIDFSLINIVYVHP